MRIVYVNITRPHQYNNNTRPHQLHWGDQECGHYIIYVVCSITCMYMWGYFSLCSPPSFVLAPHHSIIPPSLPPSLPPFLLSSLPFLPSSLLFPRSISSSSSLLLHSLPPSLPTGHRTYISYVYTEYTYHNVVMRLFVHLLLKAVKTSPSSRPRRQERSWSLERDMYGTENGTGLRGRGWR